MDPKTFTPEMITMILNVIVVPLVVWLFTKLMNLADAGIDNLRAKAGSAMASKHLDNLDAVVHSVVTSLQETTVKGLKAASEDGKITASDAANIKAEAFVNIVNILGESAMAEMHEIFGDADLMIDHKIEQMVKAVK